MENSPDMLIFLSLVSDFSDSAYPAMRRLKIDTLCSIHRNRCIFRKVANSKSTVSLRSARLFNAL